MRGFIAFVREQGIFGLAIGFIMGTGVSGLVSALVDDLINPSLSLLFGSVVNLETLSLTLNGVVFRYGHFISVFVDFLVLAFVVYLLFKYFGKNLGKIEIKAPIKK